MVDLATWNLSVPVGTPATIIETPKLVEGYQDNYFRTPSGAVIFWAPVTGSKTENAIYPRTELRESYPDGRVRNWLYSDADNFMRAALAVNKVPSSGRVVIGQIHAWNSTKPMLKLEYQYEDDEKLGNVVAKFRNRPDDEDPQVVTVAEGVPLNKRFTYSLHVTPNGSLAVHAAGYRWVTRLDRSWAPKPLYYKAGMYTQDNTGYANEGGMATFYRLHIEHKPL